MDNNTKHKILGMVAAAKLQLDELKFDAREFLEKLDSELNSVNVFEYPAFISFTPSGFDFNHAGYCLETLNKITGASSFPLAEYFPITC